MTIELGTNIRALRLRDGRTQEEVAASLGVSPQAVSRWEKSICYPDMELIPSIANYFGVSIDELFGYDNERKKRIDELAGRINRMNRENNGEDVNMDECVSLAREALIEFPGNETLTAALASVLYNAGYVRRGEYHITDEDGFDRYDTALHRTYPEWHEAILLYEKLLPGISDGAERQNAVRQLIQLYANTGDYDRADSIAKTAPPLEGCREWLAASARDGRERAEALGKLLIRMIAASADQMVQLLISFRQDMAPERTADAVRQALALYGTLFPDGRLGGCHEGAARLYLFLSEFQWRTGDKDGAFRSLDSALENARAFDAWCSLPEASYSQPLLRCVTVTHCSPPGPAERLAPDLPKVWPWWQVPDFDDVASEMRADPRWADWVRRCGESV